mgnify:CR=1 FL=1|tara:strand:- start:36387 stop:37793 length:1407 start_codon:yes stop_codon:yes gene_type:complete
MLKMPPTLENTLPFEQKWILATSKHYKIWFSHDPNEFISTENKIRCIRFKLTNPEANLSLVYSSKILNAETIVELKEFSQKLSIELIDFDTDIPLMLKHEYDEYLFRIAKGEIQNAINNNGGNLAAASDCVRLLPGVIKRCGIYSDFDVPINFSALPPTINIQSPVIFPTVIETKGTALQCLSFNNEFLGFAQNKKNPNKIAPEALDSLRSAQLEIIKRYSKPLKALQAPVIKGLHTSITLNKRLSAIIDWIGRKNISNLSIFNIRRFIDNLTIRDLLTSCYQFELETILSFKNISTYSDLELMACFGQYMRKKYTHQTSKSIIDLTNHQIANNILTNMKHALLKSSVMEISGPFIMIAFFMKKLENLDFYQIFTQDLQTEREMFIRCIQRAGLNKNGLDKYVIGQDSNPTDNKPLSDESWTPQGAHQAQIRSDTYLNAILLIQRAFRKSLSCKANKEHKPSLSNLLR